MLLQISQLAPCGCLLGLRHLRLSTQRGCDSMNVLNMHSVEVHVEQKAYRQTPDGTNSAAHALQTGQS